MPSTFIKWGQFSSKNRFSRNLLSVFGTQLTPEGDDCDPFTGIIKPVYILDEYGIATSQIKSYELQIPIPLNSDDSINSELLKTRSTCVVLTPNNVKFRIGGNRDSQKYYGWTLHKSQWCSIPLIEAT